MVEHCPHGPEGNKVECKKKIKRIKDTSALTDGLEGKIKDVTRFNPK